MKKYEEVLKKIKYALEIILASIALLLTFILCLSAILKTSYANNMIEQRMLIEGERFIQSLVFLAAFLLIGFFIVKVADEERLKYLLGFTLGLHMAYGIIMILFARSAPGADALTVFKMATQLAEGDLSFVNSTDSYLSYYPQQVGLTAFLALFVKIISVIPFEVSSHHFIKGFYCILNAVTIYFAYRTLKETKWNVKICAAFLYLSIINLPFAMYSSFIYGEIPSLTAITVSAYFFSRLVREKGIKVINMIASALFLALAVFIRKNSLIFVIAVAITAVLLFLESGKKYIYLIFIALCLALSISILPVTQKLIEKKAGDEISSGVTMYSYLAMGMQEGNRGPGWYNGFNFDTYCNTGMNTDLTNEIAYEAIEERKEYFKNDPKAFVEFYRDKFLTQWSDPTLASCQATYADFGGRSEFMNELYDGKYYPIYVTVCNLLQNAVYIGALLWTILNMISVLKDRKFRDNAFIYLGIITVIGGFIFHMFWEANSRYVFPYFCMLIPYAAMGYGSLFKAKHKRKRNDDWDDE